ncbi:MAG: PAS domain-containing protein, partial [Rhizorhabdus sp.]
MPEKSPSVVASEDGETRSAEEVVARRRAECALHEPRALLASVLDNLPLAVGVYDSDGELIQSNQRLRDYADLTSLPSRGRAGSRRWRGYDDDEQAIPPELYPGARALRGETVMPGIDFLYEAPDGVERWVRISAIPFRPEGEAANQAIVVVQDVDDLRRAAERIEAAGTALAQQARFFEAQLSSIPDFVYAFDRQRRFIYANPAMLGLFGLSPAEMLGKTFSDLDYPADLAELLDSHMDRIFETGATIEDEIFFRSPTGYAAYFAFLWGPVRADDGTVELVVGVSRDTSERRAFEEALRESEARLRAATELVGLGIYSWNPVTDELQWDERVRALWSVPS